MAEHGTGRIRTRQGTHAQRTLSAKYCFAPMPPNLLEHVGAACCCKGAGTGTCLDPLAALASRCPWVH